HGRTRQEGKYIPGGNLMHGGFTLQLSANKRRPNVQIKHLSARAALKQFAKPWKQTTSPGMRKSGFKVTERGASLIDIRTLAAALTSRSFTLATLADFLQTEHRKQSVEEHGGPLTDTYLDYAMNDVQVTWECYVALRDKYEAHGLRQ